MGKTELTSIREQIAEARTLKEELVKDESHSQEVIRLINLLSTIVEILVFVFLEKKVKTTSRNSHLPPSQCHEKHKKNKRSSSTSKKPLKGKSSSLTIEEHSTRKEVTKCKHCKASLKKVKSAPLEKRVLIDIKYTQIRYAEEAEVKCCPQCNKITKGSFSQGLYGPLQYGVGVIVYILNLLFEMIPLERLQHTLQSQFMIKLSQASILKYVTKLSVRLEGWEEYTRNKLLKATVLNLDETSVRVNKKNWWLHTHSMHDGDEVLILPHRKRGKEAIDENSIVNNYTGIAIHDCWSSYFNYDNCTHALCGAHLTRELQAAIDRHEYSWAKQMQKLLLTTAEMVAKKKKNKQLTQKEYAQLVKRYKTILTKGKKEFPPLSERKKGQRGKIKKSKAQNLHERLTKYQDSVLLFAKDKNVPFTNNRAERDLRMAKVKQKISGCFRSEEMIVHFCRIFSYLKTMKNKGFTPLYALEVAWKNQLNAEFMPTGG